MRYLGAHVFGKEVSKIAKRAGINAIQIMPSAPMRWASKDLPDESAVMFGKSLEGSDVNKVLIHGIYLINLARGDKQMFHLSKVSVVTYLNYANKLKSSLPSGIDLLGVTFHVGSVKDLSETESMKRIHQGLNWIVENSKGKEMILLESSAGAGNIMGDTFEELAEIRNGAEKKERVGYVLDTQHTFASGYDWVNDLEGVIKKIDSILGLKNIYAIHLNDSMTEMGSHKDRHANLGEGKIGIEGITNIVNHPKLKHLPFIMETPNLKDEVFLLQETSKLLGLAK